MFRVPRRLVPASSLSRRLTTAVSIIGAAGVVAVVTAPAAEGAPLKLTSVVTTSAQPGNYAGFGTTRALLGDFDGDGVGDAAYTDFDTAYVVYGSRSAPVDVDLAQDQGARVTTYSTTQTSGFVTVAKAGDFDRDGKADLVLSTGALDYIVYGTSAARGSTIALDAATSGVTRITTRSDGAVDIVGIGDFDGDGFDDLGVSRGGPGAAIIRGGTRQPTFQSNTQAARIALINATQTCAVIWFQYRCVYNRVGITPLGDFNGDGKADVGITNTSPSGNYVLFGRTGSFSVSANLPSGYLRLPTAATGQLPRIDGVGDVNGDGLKDVVVYNAKIVFGRRGTAATLPAGDPQVTLAGGGTDTGSVIGVGDQNGDGRDDVVAYVYASETDARGPLRLVTNVPAAPASLDMTSGLPVPLPAGRSVDYMAGGDDLDGDGAGDLLVGQYGGAGTWVLTHSPLTSSGGGTGQPATASLDVKLSVVGPYGRPMKGMTYSATASCNVANDPIYNVGNGETAAFTRAAFGAGDPCSIAAYKDGSGQKPNGFIYTDCNWTTSTTFNGVPQPTPAWSGAGTNVTLAAGANHFVEVDTCTFPNDPDVPTKIVDYGWNATGSAYGGGGGGDQALTTATAGQAGSIVWRAPLDLNGKTIAFTLNNTGGTGAAEGTTLAFLRDDPSSDGTDPLGGYLGGGGGQLGFGGLQGLALAFDETKQAGDPNANFIGWADGASDSGLHYLQTADPGVTLSRSKIAVKVVSKNGVVSVYVNGALKMSRTMTLPAPAHLAFTASTGASATESHIIPAAGFRITTS